METNIVDYHDDTQFKYVRKIVYALPDGGTLIGDVYYSSIITNVYKTVWPNGATIFENINGYIRKFAFTLSGNGEDKERTIHCYDNYSWGEQLSVKALNNFDSEKIQPPIPLCEKLANSVYEVGHILSLNTRIKNPLVVEDERKYLFNQLALAEKAYVEKYSLLINFLGSLPINSHLHFSKKLEMIISKGGQLKIDEEILSKLQSLNESMIEKHLKVRNLVEGLHNI